jgi:hypothetical protein
LIPFMFRSIENVLQVLFLCKLSPTESLRAYSRNILLEFAGFFISSHTYMKKAVLWVYKLPIYTYILAD